jgi:hypothetical protein
MSPPRFEVAGLSQGDNAREAVAWRLQAVVSLIRSTDYPTRDLTVAV